jgi:hypothetical protein
MLSLPVLSNAVIVKKYFTPGFNPVATYEVALGDTVATGAP